MYCNLSQVWARIHNADVKHKEFTILWSLRTRQKELLETTRKVVNVDGTDLSKIRSRINGTVNKNSRTGVNGVALTKKGTYKAYINFKHKRIHLGFFTNLKDAAAARKEAEEILYNKFLDDNAGWEQRLADAMAEYKKNKK